MSTNFSKQSMTKKVLLCLSIVSIGSSAILGAATQASATDVKAGPIWNNDDAKAKCPVAAAAVGYEWNGQWRTTVQGKESVCGLSAKKTARSVKAGPIWNNDDAKAKCPVAAAAVGRKWDGQWRTTIQGQASECDVN
jgi:hypothetical protein